MYDDSKHELNFLELATDGSRPWNYFSVQQKMNKKDKKFREKDDIDKYVENIVGDDSKLQQALIE